MKYIKNEILQDSDKSDTNYNCGQTFKVFDHLRCEYKFLHGFFALISDTQVFLLLHVTFLR